MIQPLQDIPKKQATFVRAMLYMLVRQAGNIAQNTIFRHCTPLRRSLWTLDGASRVRQDWAASIEELANKSVRRDVRWVKSHNA